MLIDDSKNQTRSYGENGRELPLAGVQPAATTNDDERTQSEETALFDLYEKIAETRPGTRDAEIFAKIREWTFSDFSTEPHAFAGISETELFAWQKRHRINLSGGHIRPRTSTSSAATPGAPSAATTTSTACTSTSGRPRPRNSRSS
ncbi:MAG: hypothetical protein WDO13_03380, partial [Verrucomicrobiota bacterium]